MFRTPIKKVAVAALSASMLLGTACSSSKPAKETFDPDATVPRAEPDVEATINLDDVERLSLEGSSITDDYRDYCIRIFQESVMNEGEDSNRNIMISPASIMFALEMTAAGAEDDTLAQMSALISPDATPMDIQSFASSYMRHLNRNSGVELQVANSVWMKESIMADYISDEFINFINEYYEAEANMCNFDNATVDEINDWCRDHTNDMIDHIIDDISSETVMFLINAIAFDGAWAEPYEDYQINDDEFTNASGEIQNIEMMHCTENQYYETDSAIGFSKYYEGYDYYFLAILPKDESVSANEFAMNFTSDDYSEFIGSCTTAYDVYTRLPKFTYEYDTSLVPVLQNMGITNAFNADEADFDSIAQIPGYYLYISNVLHNTFIEVNESGTRAAAVTTVIMNATACIEEPTPFREVFLDRPFCYAIVDASTDTPVFIGTVNDI